MNTSACILECFNSAPVSDTGKKLLHKDQKKETLDRKGFINKENAVIFRVFFLKLTLKNFLIYFTGQETLMNTFLFIAGKYKGHIMEASRKWGLKKHLRTHQSIT